MEEAESSVIMDHIMEKFDPSKSPRQIGMSWLVGGNEPTKKGF